MYFNNIQSQNPQIPVNKVIRQRFMLYFIRIVLQVFQEDVHPIFLFLYRFYERHFSPDDHGPKFVRTFIHDVPFVFDDRSAYPGVVFNKFTLQSSQSAVEIEDIFFFFLTVAECHNIGFVISA